MNAPRNLTPERGPSVWDKPPQSSPYWPIVALAAFAVAAGVAWRYRSFGRTLVAKGAGLGGMVLGFADAVRRVDGIIDDALEDTFPASDPPALSYRR